jgi:hypothetical protein
VGRPERPLDPFGGPLPRFALALRQLRAAAGYPSYRTLARTALFSPSVLSTAAGGMSFPSLEVTLAYARACGGDVMEWRARWESAAAALSSPHGSPGIRQADGRRRARAEPGPKAVRTREIN